MVQQEFGHSTPLRAVADRKSKQNDSPRGKFLPKDQLSEIMILSEDWALFVNGNAQYFLVGDTGIQVGHVENIHIVRPKFSNERRWNVFIGQDPH